MDGRQLARPSPGALAVVARGTPHALGNRTKQAVRFLNSGNPAGFERFFADTETTARRFPYGSPEFFAVLMNVYKKYDSEMLRPVPQHGALYGVEPGTV